MTWVSRKQAIMSFEQDMTLHIWQHIDLISEEWDAIHYIPTLLPRLNSLFPSVISRECTFPIIVCSNLQNVR